MKIVISAADYELNNLLKGQYVNKLFAEKVAIPISVNGVVIETIITQYNEVSRKDGSGGFNGELTFESLKYIRPSKEELQAQDAVKKAKESLRAAEETLKVLKERK